MTGQWKTLKDACDILGVSESTLRRRIKQGGLQSKVENNKRLIFIQEVNQMTGQMTGYTIEHLQSENERFLQENRWLKEQLDHKDTQLEEKDTDLRKERAATEEARQRSDTIILQLTRQLEQSQRLLEHQEEPWYRRMFRQRRQRESKTQ